MAKKNISSKCKYLFSSINREVHPGQYLPLSTPVQRWLVAGQPPDHLMDPPEEPAPWLPDGHLVGAPSGLDLPAPALGQSRVLVQGLPPHTGLAWLPQSWGCQGLAGGGAGERGCRGWGSTSCVRESTSCRRRSTRQGYLIWPGKLS